MVDKKRLCGLITTDCNFLWFNHCRQLITTIILLLYTIILHPSCINIHDLIFHLSFISNTHRFIYNVFIITCIIIIVIWILPLIVHIISNECYYQTNKGNTCQCSVVSSAMLITIEICFWKMYNFNPLHFVANIHCL